MVSHQWKAHSRELVKVNLDATLDKDNKNINICLIMRNLIGDVLAMLQASKNNIIDLVVG